MFYACFAAIILSSGTGYAVGFAALVAAMLIFLNECGVELSVTLQLCLVLVAMAAPLSAMLLGRILESSFESAYPKGTLSLAGFALSAAILMQNGLIEGVLGDLLNLASKSISSGAGLTLALSILSRLIICAGISASLILILVGVAETLSRVVLHAGKASTVLPFNAVRLMLIVLILATSTHIISGFFNENLALKTLTLVQSVQK